MPAKAKTARFVVQTKPRVYEVREGPLPKIGADDGLLEVEACGVCGTDHEVFEGQLGDRYPIIPGHEPFGRIVKLGKNAQAKWGVKEGDRVAVHSTLTCGRCRTCRAGLRGCTAPEFADSTIYGFRSPDVPPGLWGGFSTHLYLAPEAIVLPMSDKLSIAEGSVFNVMSNGVDWVTEVGGVRAGQSVAILGPGPRGLASIVAASAAGAGPIAVTGLASDRPRLDLALEMGADHAIEVTPDMSVAEAVVEAMGCAPDLVVDCTPMHVGAVTDAVMMAARKGTVVLAGMKGPGPAGMAPIPVDIVSGKQLTLKGAVSRAVSSMERAIQLVESRKWPFEKFASHSFSLDNAAEGVSSLLGENKPMHVRIEPWS
jgi:threonine dehydrogenase-like Zn-dependent dehydrogenase